MNDESKLPKWAQTDLITLRRQVEHLRQELDARHGNVPTKLALVDYSELGGPDGRMKFHYHSDSMPVSFAFRDNNHDDYNKTIQCHILDRYGELVLEISGNYYITPRSGNLIWLTPRDK